MNLFTPSCFALLTFVFSPADILDFTPVHAGLCDMGWQNSQAFPNLAEMRIWTNAPARRTHADIRERGNRQPVGRVIDTIRPAFPVHTWQSSFSYWVAPDKKKKTIWWTLCSLESEQEMEKNAARVSCVSLSPVWEKMFRLSESLILKDGKINVLNGKKNGCPFKPKRSELLSSVSQKLWPNFSRV